MTYKEYYIEWLQRIINGVTASSEEDIDTAINEYNNSTEGGMNNWLATRGNFVCFDCGRYFNELPVKFDQEIKCSKCQ